MPPRQMSNRATPTTVPGQNARYATSQALRTVRRNPPITNAQQMFPLTDRERQVRRMQKMARFGERVANYGMGISFGMGGNTMLSGEQDFYSAQLPKDFLEKPQNLREQREIYRTWYRTDEMVAQAIDLHTELPLSKVRLSAPKPRTCPPGFKDADDYGKYILSFFKKMAKKIKLFQTLVTIVHHYWLDGNVAIFAEDSDVDVPPEVGYTPQEVETDGLDGEGNPIKVQQVNWIAKDNAEQEELEYYRKHYKGWDRLVVFPIDQVEITTFGYGGKTRVDLIPSARDRDLVERANQGDAQAQEMVAEIPDEVREFLGTGQLIPLGSDPNEGSFVYVLQARKGAGDELGSSLLDRCMNTLIYRDKLRQAQTQIASRAMTPRRVIWADDIADVDVEQLREQVDLSLVDPDYSIIVNYEVHWEEMSARDRLLDLSSEYEQTERRMRTGLGVTESLMSGETLYSGDRLKLEVINQRYLFLREILQTYVEDNLFEPVARRKGFVEKDEWGEEVVLYPSLSFTRLPLRDSQDTFDALFNLYTKGSVDIETILDMFNLDAHDIRKRLEADAFSVNDATFNEVFRGTYGEVGRMLAEQTTVVEKIAKYLNLSMKAPPEAEADNRFG